MRKPVILAAAVLAMAGATTVRASNPEYEYRFVSDPAVPQHLEGQHLVPGNPTDGSPISDWGGELFLDSPTSLGGSLSDIDLSRSWFQTSDGTFNLDDPTITMTLNGLFTWDTLAITSMNITGNVQGSAFTLDDSFIFIQPPDPQDNGQWLAAAPDAGSTAWLVGLAGAGLAGFARFNRNRRTFAEKA